MEDCLAFLTSQRVKGCWAACGRRFEEGTAAFGRRPLFGFIDLQYYPKFQVWLVECTRVGHSLSVSADEYHGTRRICFSIPLATRANVAVVFCAC